MKTKQVKLDSMNQLFNGVDKLCSAVSVTMGAKGKDVILEKDDGTPVITNDGVTIAKAIKLEDNIENLGVEIVKQASIKTNDVAGDGTTTSIVLAHSMIKEGKDSVKEGANPLMIKEGMNQAVNLAKNYLKDSAILMDSNDKIKEVASLSSQSQEIGEIIAKIIKSIGKDGAINIEGSDTSETTFNVVKGLQMQSGFISPYMEREFKDVSILLVDGEINSFNSLVPLLEKIVEGGKKDLVILCNNIDANTLHTIVQNRIKGVFNILAIKIPEFESDENIKDLEAITGAEVINGDKGITLEKAELIHLGSSDKVISSEKESIIIGGKGKGVDKRVKALKGIAAALTGGKLEAVERRIGRLTGGVGVIKVGGLSEIEQSAKIMRVEDAVAAVKAAMSEGIVKGGGYALFDVSQILDSIETPKDKDIATGYNIISKACRVPAQQILINAGFTSDEVLNAYSESACHNKGFDASKSINDKIEIVDLIELGIVDPVKVTRTALENAASVASTFLTTNCIVCNSEKKA